VAITVTATRKSLNGQHGAQHGEALVKVNDGTRTYEILGDPTLNVTDTCTIVNGKAHK
jgi:hypothetical protein